MTMLKKGTEAGQIAAGIDYSLYVSQLQSMLGSCPDLQSDLKKIDDWAQIFSEPELFGKTVTINFIKEKDLVEGDIKLLEQYWDAGDYYTSGLTLAYIANVLVGPIPAPIL